MQLGHLQDPKQQLAAAAAAAPVDIKPDLGWRMSKHPPLSPTVVDALMDPRHIKQEPMSRPPLMRIIKVESFYEVVARAAVVKFRRSKRRLVHIRRKTGLYQPAHRILAKARRFLAVPVTVDLSRVSGPRTIRVDVFLQHAAICKGVEGADYRVRFVDDIVALGHGLLRSLRILVKPLSAEALSGGHLRCRPSTWTCFFCPYRTSILLRLSAHVMERHPSIDVQFPASCIHCGWFILLLCFLR